MKRSVNYASAGERLTPELVTNVPSFTSYAQQELGLSLPLGNGRRQGWSKYCKEELDVQGWTVDDLVTAVRYVKARKKQCRTLYGIFWYVKDARAWEEHNREYQPKDSLHLKVAEAISTESDEGWARRLSLAQGKALEVVYGRWLEERLGPEA